MPDIPPTRPTLPGPPVLPLSGTSGIHWPAIGGEDDARLFALQFQLQDSEWWPPERLLGHQLEQIAILLRHAARTVPYYRDRLSAFAAETALPPSIEEFRRIPLLRRTDIQDFGEALRSESPPPDHGRLVHIRTTGSTGRPLQVVRAALSSTISRALAQRYHLWHRRDFAATNVTIGTLGIAGLPAARENGWVPGYQTGESFRLDATLPINELLDWVIRADPAYLQAHPSMLLGMIHRSREIGARPKSLREVRTFGEALEPALRKVCRREWEVPISDIYSANETATIALQCPEQPHYHVQSEAILVEVLDSDDRPCAPGETGRVVVTPLHNFAMPLIRYELGDYATVGGACPCGRGLPVIDRIVGRYRNLVVLPDGGTQFPDFGAEPVLLDLPIRQFQLIQKSRERIDVTLAVHRPLTADDEENLRAFFARAFRHRFLFPIAYVDDIPSLPGGKYEVFRSEIADATDGAG